MRKERSLELSNVVRLDVIADFLVVVEDGMHKVGHVVLPAMYLVARSAD
jgi:hypothetical protein